MKNYLIIGGSSGIGLSSSLLLAANGHKVFATFNTKAPENPTTDITYFHYNVLEDKSITDHLPDRLDGVVYCPGSINLKPFRRISPEAFRKDYDLQFIGAVKVIQEVMPLLKTGKTSSVVLFSTVAVQNGFPFHSMISASKGAIEGFSKALAAELAPQIRVNCIAPSLTATPLAKRLLSSEEKIENNAQRHPLKRIGKAEDIANAVHFLLSEDSGWMTGQVVKIDGGLSTLRI